MKKTLLILLILAFVNINAQDEELELYKWSPAFVTGLNISQITFENWAKGGENSLAYTVTGDFALRYLTENWKFRNQFKGAFGKTKLGQDEIRTTDNEFFFETVLSYKILGWEVNPFISNLVRSAITSGYDYKTTPKTKIADFFDPGYVTQSIGFTYDKHENFRTRLGIAFQETFTREDALALAYSDDPETAEIEKFKFETGLESVTDMKLNVDKNLIYQSKLRLFTRFEDIDIWDVRWDNTITAEVNSWLNVNLSVIIIHEVSQTVKTQFKEALQIGITYSIL
ncbi:MAG: DUF3078 domain-containing protein [Melioribacteraceae bacterium]|nr:DUF3078 domain-containing protein [Melioribacteraceae bacterium]MCF8355360.1 DUF3078 domain-containing protein [Melioribacteraceae bacterium]MCF8395172.1 DUF3078 domain-containing protein [Melioribacteraceae bacterium]MCF8420259.1 DUF3078 domain-containing protein [Melioribacteraceae bacterium]